ncbi:hypothetical protein [Methylomicrobium sp. Wu6]|uniref:hypothetical protein n=1 Tax=Methylomicrobium sp. Wu6 TaxID=3107928 RepID=UPI002DD6281E|nr:hypothetical protein [Methylomicrobium sp. Wu6]
MPMNLLLFTYYRDRGTQDLGVYVGITHDPEARFAQHQAKMAELGYKEWEEMIVVYGTYSLAFAIQVENEMIKYFERHNVYSKIKFNTKGPQYFGNQSFSLYLLVKNISLIPLLRTVNTGLKDPNDAYVTYWPEDRCSGHYNSQLIDTLKRRVKKYAEKQKTIYIGMTNDPHRRLSEHYSSKDIDGMIVLYESNSLDYVAKTEAVLIEYAKKNLSANCINDKSSLMLNSPYFYVYFLFDRGRP